MNNNKNNEEVNDDMRQIEHAEPEMLASFVEVWIHTHKWTSAEISSYLEKLKLVLLQSKLTHHR